MELFQENELCDNINNILVNNGAAKGKTVAQELAEQNENFLVKVDRALELIKDEVIRAVNKFPKPFNSYHEGYGVIAEEWRELEIEVFKSKHDKNLLRAEAVQLGAMTTIFIYQLCE